MAPHKRIRAYRADRLVSDRRKVGSGRRDVVSGRMEVVLDDATVLARLEGAFARSDENETLNPARGLVRGVLISLCLWLFLLFALIVF